MSKTIYIEQNEEVTSVIDQVKSIKDKEIVLVIPKKAAIVQSALNLKILKRQLDKLKKESVIITSDKLGKNLASKAGFVVKQKIENSNSLNIKDEEADDKQESGEVAPKKTSEDKDREVKPPSRNLKMIDIIKKGADDTFSNAINISENANDSEGKQDLSKSNKKLEKDEIGSDDVFALMELKNKKLFKKNTEKHYLGSELTSSKNNTEPMGDLVKNKKVVILPSFGKKLFIAIFLITILVAGVVLFLVLPTAAITITPKSELIAEEAVFVIDGAIEQVDAGQLKIPGKLVEASKEITKEFKATGKKKITQKATGVITVYNDWDSKGQPLVATTRFISEDEKLFRSTEDVVVPGFQRSEGEDVSGTVKVAIVADEPGEEWNIGPARFSIPGLKGTVKYEKIYGVSTESMSGGKIGEVTVVSESDFENAKNSFEQNINEELLTEIKNQSNGKTKIIDSTIFIEKEDFVSSKKLSEEADNFSLTLKLAGSAMTFDEEQVSNLIKEIMKEQIPVEKYLLVGEPTITYGEADFSPKQEEMSLKVHFESLVTSKIKKDDILKNIKGKNIEELQDYFSNIEEIKNVDINFRPFWVKHVPSLEDKVNIDIK